MKTPEDIVTLKLAITRTVLAALVVGYSLRGLYDQVLASLFDLEFGVHLAVTGFCVYVMVAGGRIIHHVLKYAYQRTPNQKRAYKSIVGL